MVVAHQPQPGLAEKSGVVDDRLLGYKLVMMWK